MPPVLHWIHALTLLLATRAKSFMFLPVILLALHIAIVDFLARRAHLGCLNWLPTVATQSRHPFVAFVSDGFRRERSEKATILAKGVARCDHLVGTLRYMTMAHHLLGGSGTKMLFFRA